MYSFSVQVIFSAVYAFAIRIAGKLQKATINNTELHFMLVLTWKKK